MWSSLLLGACAVGLNPIPPVPQPVDTGSIAEDTSAESQSESQSETEPDAPPPERKDVWIYTGHGGLGVASANGRGGIEAVQNHWRGEGWNTVVMSELPDIEEMDQPRLLVLAAPGSRTQVRFESLDVRKIERFLESDGLLALYVDSCSNPHFNTLLSSIGLGMQLSGDSNQSAFIVRNAEVDSASALVSDIEKVTMMEPCRLSVNRGTSLVYSEVGSITEVYVASGNPDAGGQAIVLGDFQLVDDAGYFTEADNKAFASRLAERTPETVR